MQILIPGGTSWMVGVGDTRAGLREWQRECCDPEAVESGWGAWFRPERELIRLGDCPALLEGSEVCGLPLDAWGHCWGRSRHI